MQNIKLLSNCPPNRTTAQDLWTALICSCLAWFALIHLLGLSIDVRTLLSLSSAVTGGATLALGEAILGRFGITFTVRERVSLLTITVAVFVFCRGPL